MSKLINCEMCDKEINKNATVCPHCGEPMEIQKTTPKSKKKVEEKKYGFGTLIVAVVFVFMIISAFNDDNENAKKKEPTQKDKETVWIIKGKDAVKNKLKDPNSAKFKDVYYFNKGVHMTCGKVQSKNSLNGYSSFQRLVSAGKASNTFLEEQVSDFETVWKNFCI